MFLCEQKNNIDLFGCYSLRYPKIFDYPPCPYPYSFDLDIAECLKQCPHECNSVTYSQRVSFSEYPSRNYMEFLIKNNVYLSNVLFPPDQHDPNTTSRFDDLVLARDSLAKIFVYFDEIKYTKISEEISVTFFDLIANIGGTLGLFIGISLLSFVELFELFFEIIRILWSSFNSQSSRL